MMAASLVVSVVASLRFSPCCISSTALSAISRNPMLSSSFLYDITTYTTKASNHQPTLDRTAFCPLLAGDRKPAMLEIAQGGVDLCLATIALKQVANVGAR